MTKPGMEYARTPDAVITLVEHWRRDGQPAQPAINWPREKWIAALPRYGEAFHHLPVHP